MTKLIKYFCVFVFLCSTIYAKECLKNTDTIIIEQEYLWFFTKEIKISKSNKYFNTLFNSSKKIALSMRDTNQTKYLPYIWKNYEIHFCYKEDALDGSMDNAYLIKKISISTKVQYLKDKNIILARYNDNPSPMRAKYDKINDFFDNVKAAIKEENTIKQ